MTMPVIHPTFEPFFAETADLIINVIGDLYIEVKSKHLENLAGENAYTWDFGDSTGAVNGNEVTHTYDVPGEKTITVQINTKSGVLTHSITFVLPDGSGQTLHRLPEQKKSEEDAAA